MQEFIEEIGMYSEFREFMSENHDMNDEELEEELNRITHNGF